MKDNGNFIKPKRWEESENPPCAVSYYFTLLDVSKDLRYCCHGAKVLGKYQDLKQQWSDDVYNQFRADWSNNYQDNKELCLGCPHQEENIINGNIIKEYLDSTRD